MNVSLYQAAAAMNANARWQELISQNLAADSVPGFRKQDISFSAVEAGLGPSRAGWDATRYVMPAATATVNLQPGELQPTGNATDFAIEGPGFFEVQLPNGSHAYTRDGEFHLSAQGQLVTKEGYAVLGDSGPLQFDPNNSAPITVSATGAVSQGDQPKGRMRLVEFNQPGRLTAIGQSYFLADQPGVRPSTAAASAVRQGFLEGANTTPAAQMADLITALRMFETNEKVLQMQDERMGAVISQLGNPS